MVVPGTRAPAGADRSPCAHRPAFTARRGDARQAAPTGGRSWRSRVGLAGMPNRSMRGGAGVTSVAAIDSLAVVSERSAYAHTQVRAVDGGGWGVRSPSPSWCTGPLSAPATLAATSVAASTTSADRRSRPWRASVTGSMHPSVRTLSNATTAARRSRTRIGTEAFRGVKGCDTTGCKWEPNGVRYMND